MKNKNILKHSYNLLKKLTIEEKTFFTVSEASGILNLKNPSITRELLRSMEKKGFIIKIKDSLYYVIPYKADKKNYYPDKHLIAGALSGGREYYLGFYTALEIHGLLNRTPAVEHIVLKSRIQPKLTKIKKTGFEFITYNKKHFFGYEEIWVDDYNKVNCSDFEKTIIDCLYKPDCINGITEIIKVINKNTHEINKEKLLNYLEKFEAQVVLKRLGFILENINKFEELREKLNSQISNSYTLLDPSRTKSGKHNSKWKIVDNINIKEELKTILI